MEIGTRLKLTELKVQAQAVGAQHDAHEVSRVEKRNAVVALLEAVVDAVKPGLRAICSKITTATVRSRQASSSEDAIGTPGVFLGAHGPKTKDSPGPSFDFRNQSWGGSDLFLLQDGVFVLLTYDGTADDANGISEWSAHVTQLQVGDVIDMFPPAVVMDAIATALAKEASGNKARRTKETFEQAERLRSMVNLVRQSL